MENTAENPIKDVIERLGGHNAVAAKLKISPSAVMMWSTRRTIPGRWHLPLLQWASETGRWLTPADLLPPPGSAPKGPGPSDEVAA